MKNKIIEHIRFFIALILFIFGISKLRSFLIWRKSPLVRVILVHHIKSKENFERMISFIVKNYNVISFDDFISGNFVKDKINILLTLDDGYKSWVKIGKDSLEKFNFPAVFFVSSGFVGSSNSDKWKDFCKTNLLLNWNSEPISLSDLNSLPSWIEVGGHSVQHSFLTKINKTNQLSDIGDDKEYLEKNIGREVKVFAYPFGDYNNEVVSSVRDIGYKFAMTTDSDFFIPGVSDPLRIPRSNHGTVSNFVLRMWISGAFDVSFKIQKFFSKILK